MKSLRKLRFKFFSIVAAGLLSLVFFQNCSQKTSENFLDSRVEEVFNYFGYRYAKATPIYFEIQIIPESSDATYQTYKLLAFAGNSNGDDATDIQYQFQVYDETGVSMCPVKSGTLDVSANSMIEETCIALKTKVLGYAEIKTRNPGQEWEIYKKIYSDKVSFE